MDGPNQIAGASVFSQFSPRHMTIGLLLLFCLASSCLFAAQEGSFPDAAELIGAKAGDLVVRPGTYQGQKADWGMLVVPEDRGSPGAKLLHLPVLRIRAKNNTGQPPVFYFFGGPGAANIHTWWPEAFYRDHDFVQVGYRGVDGSVKLDIGDLGKTGADELLMSPESLKRLGRAVAAGLSRLRKEGIALDCYTMVDVVDDMEAARQAFKYGPINLLSHSYGTQLASVYCLRYPRSLSRNLMVGASAPGFATLWEPAQVDRILYAYTTLWSQDPKCSTRTSDLVGTMRDTFASLPRHWRSVRIDPDKVKLVTFKMLYDTGTAVQAFDAYVSAKEGDWSGLAQMCYSWDRNAPSGLGVGDSFCKLMSAGIYEPGRDYLREMAPSNSVLGSPSTRLSFGMVQLCPELRSMVSEIPKQYQKGQRHGVKTLIVNGALDASSPVETARQELLPYLQDGRLLVLPNMGHNDPFTSQPEAFIHLMDTFYRTGEADSSKFIDKPLNFTPSRRLADLAKEIAP